MTHLVWDWNGTLLDDLTLTIEATNASLAMLGCPPVTLERHRRTFRRPLTEYYAEVLGRVLRDGDFELLDAAFHRAYRAGLTSCELAADALAAIRAWPGTQSVLSMWSHPELVAELERRGLTGWLVRVDGRPAEPLGDRKGVYLARHLAALGVAGRDTVLIGDCTDDADAAAAVGARCVLYSGGITDADQLRATGHPVADTLLDAVRIAGTPAPRAPGGAGRRPAADRAS